jgi:hypothetical protein
VVIDYQRHDLALEVFARGDDAILRLTLPGGSRTETGVPRSVVDRAAMGDDRPLREWVVPAGIAAAMASTAIAEPEITRVTISVSERRWATIAWESLAAPPPSPVACVVRVSDVRPRVRQAPFSFPMRILEVGGAQFVRFSLQNVFFDADRDAAVVDEVVPELFNVEPFLLERRWPTVDILHLHQLPLASPSGAFGTAALQPLLERYQTRLVIIEAALTILKEAREVAQTIVERGGPAVWIVDATAAPGMAAAYAYIIHDRPLDWIKAAVGLGELFAGAGREELLRYSTLARAFESQRVVHQIAAAIPPRLPEGAPPTPPPTASDTQAAVKESVRAAHVYTDATGAIVFANLDRSRALRLGGLVSTQLASRGVYAADVDQMIERFRRERRSVAPSELAKEIEAKARPLRGFDQNEAADALAANLRHISTMAVDLTFEDHESEGMLPLAANIAGARSLLQAVRGQRPPAIPRPRNVNTAFFTEKRDGVLERLPQESARLRPGELVQFGVQIGEKDRLVATLGSTALLEEVFRSPTGTSVEIGLTAIDFDLVGDPVQHLWLPPDGETDLVTFAVRPRTTTPVRGIARLRVSLFHKNNVVQSFLVAALLEGAEGDLANGLASALHANADEVRSVGSVGYLTRMEYSALPIMFAGEAPPRALSVIANESAGQKITTIKGTDLFEVSNDQSILDSVKDARDALKRASADESNVYRYTFNGGDNAGDPKQLLDLLWNVAIAGWNIFFGLVPNEGRQQAVRADLASALGIHAAHIDAGAVVPWSLVYDRKVFDRKWMADPYDPTVRLPVERALCRASMPAADGTMPGVECGGPGCLLEPSENVRRRAEGRGLVCEETVICPRRFWGFMHSIEVPVQQVPTVKPPEAETVPFLATTIRAGNPVEVVTAFNPNLSFSKAHEEKLRELFKGRAALLKPQHDGRDAVLDELEIRDPDIVYLFCHAIATLDDKTGRRIGPVLDFGKGYAGVADDVLEDSALSGRQWTHAPLVFMNGCSTAGFSPYASAKFIKTFIRSRNASAVIGTEVSVWEVLAAGFAAKFLDAFLARKNAGEALLLARRALLAQENPLGLVYTLYGSSDLKIG